MANKIHITTIFTTLKKELKLILNLKKLLKKKRNIKPETITNLLVNFAVPTVGTSASGESKRTNKL
jgi:capsular polysaccharide biosynthesis protein